MPNTNKSLLINPATIVYLILALTLVTSFILAPDFFFLTLAGYIFFIFLHSIAKWSSEKTKIGYPICLGISVFLFLLAIALYWVYLVPVLSEQIRHFTPRIPQIHEKIVSLLSPYFPEETLEKNLSLDHLKDSPLVKTILSRVDEVAGTILTILTTMLVIFVVGIYFATSPKTYRNILNSIVSPQNRAFSDKIFDRIHHSLTRWLGGRLLSMGVLSLLTTIGLFTLGVDLALPLGVFAGVACFIPNLGPIISLIPAALVGLLDSASTALYVVILYVGIQLVESYLITPVIDNNTVSLPPAWLILFQILMGMLFGIAGLALAAPLLLICAILAHQLLAAGWKTTQEP